MARWQRDPMLQRRLTLLLLAVEVSAVTLNFFSIGLFYAHRLSIRLGGGVQAPLFSDPVLYVVVGLAALGVLAGLLFQGRIYFQSLGWARWAFIGENVLLLLLGVALFVINKVHGGSPDAALRGLAIPFATLFPLLGLLLAFKPSVPTTPRRP
jgi:hypothetical protein